MPKVLPQIEFASTELGTTKYRSPVPKERTRRDRCFHRSTSNKKHREEDDDNENREGSDPDSSFHALSSLD